MGLGKDAGENTESHQNTDPDTFYMELACSIRREDTVHMHPQPVRFLFLKWCKNHVYITLHFRIMNYFVLV